MTKAAIVVLAGVESKSDLGRVANALEAAKEFEEAGDEVQLVFDGAGTQWVDELSDEEHKYHSLWQAVNGDAVACSYCADAYDVTEVVEESAADLRDEYEGHPSMREFVADGYEIITY